MQRLTTAVLRSGVIATAYWPGERGPIGRIIEPRKAKIDQKVLRRAPGMRVTLRLSAEILAPSCDNRMEGIRIHIRRLKYDVLIRAITDADRIRNNTKCNKTRQAYRCATWFSCMNCTPYPMNNSEPQYFEKGHRTHFTGLGKGDEFSESLESRVIMTS